MLNEFISIISIYLAAIMLPGPSLSLIIRNGLLFSRNASILATIGILMGIALQCAVVLIALSFFSEDTLIFNFLKIVTSLYLMYLGFKSIKGYPDEKVNNSIIPSKRINMLMEGFLVETLNPIAFSFFLSIFLSTSQSLPAYIKIFYWLGIICCGAMWFISVAMCSSSYMLTNKLKSFKRYIEISCGIIFILFGLQSFL